ncbi:MAG: thioredoxin [Sphingobacteriales bacterium]|nr:thioredoxin [Sphingobacteriales bacterium]
MPNNLIYETSPYLLQHANNPVNWFAWGKEALTRAKDKNKLILVSIGYSACHWCHVMEHESFEDEQVAQIMNDHFVCIKIDREERPDIDQIYMQAVQLMTGRGGWPLNVICLPDQRPIYGGTYFSKTDWMNLLLNLADFYKTKPNEAEEYAVRLTEGIRESEQIKFIEQKTEYNNQDLIEIFDSWKRHFDLKEGGYNRAPKFPLPNNWLFMLRYSHLMNDATARESVFLTLDKMAFGGIYDQIGGGFARYSVDERWHVPHFEKMLYDNSQLVSLYAEAWQLTNKPLYKQIVYETLDFVKRELTSPEGGFYAALDADSEGVEGKFYTFTREELIEILGADEKIFSAYYNLSDEGNWEEEQTNVFFRKTNDEYIAKQFGLEITDLEQKIDELKMKVFNHRSTRVRPGLDNKILTSWNGMMLKAYVDAYRIFDEQDFLDIAIANINFIVTHASRNGKLKRVVTMTGPLTDKYFDEALPAFLDDYALVIEALISLYEATFNEMWLLQANFFTETVITNFFDDSTGMFFYTSASGEQLIARKQEIMDNVMPSSNSVMAHNLYKLGYYYDKQDYLNKSAQMLRNVYPLIKTYGSAYSNWALLLLTKVFGIYEIAITGADFESKRKEIEQHYIPNKILLGGTFGTLPLLQDKWGAETLIFVCRNKTCQLPVSDVAEALKQIN